MGSVPMALDVYLCLYVKKLFCTCVCNARNYFYIIKTIKDVLYILDLSLMCQNIFPNTQNFVWSQNHTNVLIRISMK